MTLTFNALQAVTIRAFLEALAKINEPLPPDLIQQINQVGNILTTEPKKAVDRLLDLAEHETLNSIYKQIRLDIQKQYVPGELNKYLSLPEEEGAEEPSAETIKNVMAVILNSPKPEEEAKTQSPKFKMVFSRWFGTKKHD